MLGKQLYTTIASQRTVQGVRSPGRIPSCRMSKPTGKPAGRLSYTRTATRTVAMAAITEAGRLMKGHDE